MNNTCLKWVHFPKKDIDDSWNNVRNWKKIDWELFKQEGEQLNQDLAKQLVVIKPNDLEVQALIQRHYSWVKKILDTNQSELHGASSNVSGSSWL